MKPNLDEFNNNAGFGRFGWAIWVRFWNAQEMGMRFNRWEFYMGKNGTLGALSLFSEPELFKTKTSAEEWLKRTKDYFEDEIRFRVKSSGNGLKEPDGFAYRIEWCRWSMHLVPMEWKRKAKKESTIEKGDTK